MTEQTTITKQAKGGFKKSLRADMEKWATEETELAPRIRAHSANKKKIKATAQILEITELKHGGAFIHAGTSTSRPKIMELLDELAETEDQRAFVVIIKTAIKDRTTKTPTQVLKLGV